MREPKTVSLVLGSGGARGLAHIGVIRWLEAHDYAVRSIAGSSMGALIGGIYATGKLDVYTAWVSALERLDVLRLVDLSFARAGLFKGERIMDVLRELIGDCRIEQLPVSYTAVATDLDSGKEVWLREGLLFDAIRASIAIPLLLVPARLDGRRLVDGGVVNPIPIAPTLNDRTDLTIAVNLSGKPEAAAKTEPSTPLPAPPTSYKQRISTFIENLWASPPKPEPEDLGLFEIALRAMDTMQDTIARLKLAAYTPDVIIDIPSDVCAFHEFHRAKELIAIGEARTEEAMASRQR